MAEDVPLAQVTPGAVELQLRLGEERSINPRGIIRQRLERKQHCAPMVRSLAPLARQTGQVTSLMICASRKLAMALPCSATMRSAASLA